MHLWGGITPATTTRWKAKKTKCKKQKETSREGGRGRKSLLYLKLRKIEKHSGSCEEMK